MRDRPIPAFGVVKFAPSECFWFTARSKSAAARHEFLERGICASWDEALALALAAAAPGSETVHDEVLSTIETALRLGKFRHEIAGRA